MKLEDIPEIQFEDNGKIFIPKDNTKYDTGKFVELVHIPINKYFLYANCDKSNDHRKLYLDFVDKYELNINNVRCLGGGLIRICSSDILVNSDSINYGKYHEEILRPIMERFISQYLPNHTLVIE